MTPPTAPPTAPPREPIAREGVRGSSLGASTFGAGRRLRPTEPAFLELLGFLWDEATLLDHDDLLGWRALHAPDISYTMPVRVTRKRNTGSEFHDQMMHLDEDYNSLGFRIRRFEETNAWAEDPPSRTRRFVTNVRAFETDLAGEYDVSSALLLTRNQDDDYRVDIVTAERQDRLRSDGTGGFRIARRVVLVDQATIGTPNLAVFF
jgi:3-phenylpropionate/cinnamic acid dioxygenase small subunit